MKKMFILFMAFGLVAASCNNNKVKSNVSKDREKDDYSRGNKDNNKPVDDEDNDNRGKWVSRDATMLKEQCEAGMKDVGYNSNQAEQICDCSLEKAQNKYSSLDQMSYEEMSDIGRDCALSVLNNGTKNMGDTDDGGDWTRNEKQRFMNNCERDASKTVSASRANQYCDCMLQKIKSLFSTYAAADKGLTESEMREMAVDCVR